MRGNKGTRARKAPICQSLITLRGRRQSLGPEQGTEMQLGHLNGYDLYTK